jgi:hypothetical protein
MESLSWSEEHFVRVAVILAELASHDPGGNWSNRPANSLITILLPWHPQTLAPFNKRITSIKAISTDFPNVAWKVLLSLLPKQHQTSFGVYKPRWCNIISEDWEPKVTDKEYWDQVTGYAELAVEMACSDLSKLKELVKNLDNLPKPSFDAVLEYLTSEDIANLSEDQRISIWTNLTEFAMKHRRFSDAEWALEAEDVSKIEATANKLAPSSPEGLYSRLFITNEFSLFDKKGEYEEQRKKLYEMRQHAVQEIMNTKGLQGVIAFVDKVNSPNQVGLALGVIADNDIDHDLIPNYLDVENITYRQFTASFVWSRYQCQGWQWVDGLDRTNWSLVQSCLFLINLPFEVATWDRASKWLDSSENTYWQTVQVNPYQSENDLLFAIDKLLEVSRPQAAIDCLYARLYKKLPLDTKRTVKTLLDCISTSEPAISVDHYQIAELIKELQNDPNTDQDDLFRVEWAYLPLLKSHSGAKPKLLEKLLATKPEFFCEVTRLIFRSKNEEKPKEELDEKRKAIASNAWRLLHEWRRPPGLNDDGRFSPEDFEVWLKSVKQECKKSGHLEVAMIKVGAVLFYCPSDSDGLWIDKVAACALNARDAEEMRRGFRTEVFNSRGSHWVDPTGKPERELATRWRKKASDVEDAGYARFAVILRELADSYDRDAERIIEEHKPEK